MKANTEEKQIFCFVILFLVNSRNVSRVTRGSDPRVEELKLQNRQLLEELFALKKAGEEKEEEMAELRGQVLCDI